MTAVHTPANRLESIERTLIEVFGLLSMMQDDKSIPLAWQSHVAETQNKCGVAVLDVIELRRKSSSTYNGETHEVKRISEVDDQGVTMDSGSL